jgi:hypothetical protein
MGGPAVRAKVDDGVVSSKQESPPRRVPSWWDSPETIDSPGRRRRPLRIALIAVVAAAVLAGAVYLAIDLATKGDAHIIHGALDVGTTERNGKCRLASIYGGIAQGTPVIVTDVRGSVLATTTLGPGAPQGPYCEFLFTARVPDRAVYGIEVDHRGRVLYSKAYLDLFRWNAGLALRGEKLTWV